MKWSFRKVCTAGLLAGVVLATGSCADNGNMLVIIGAMSAQPPDCVYTPTANSVLLFSGVVDVAFGGHYSAVLLVSNQLALRGSKARLRAESSNITIDNAVVSLYGNGETLISTYSVPASGYVPVGAGQDVGYGAIAVDVIPDRVDLGGGGKFVIAEVKLQGKTSGGTDIESNVFRYEIYTVDSSSGNGGLVTYNVLAADGRGSCNPDDCANGSANTATYCRMGQDEQVSCCSCLQRSFCAQQP